MLQTIKNKFVNTLVKVVKIVLSNPDVKSYFQSISMDALNQSNNQDNIDQRLLTSLDNAEVRKKIWVLTNIRPATKDYHWAVYPNSIYEQGMRAATQEAVDFVRKNMPNLKGRKSSLDLLEYCLSQTRIEGLICEFGVYSGTTINHIASLVPDKDVHGFDSFEGLPEAWGSAPKGLFSNKGEFPAVKDNVILHKGLFAETLPEFISEHDLQVSFVHIDSDLYSSAKTILETLSSRIVAGSILVFDEYFNYPEWQDHEYKAFMEFVSDFNVDFEYIAYTDRGYSVGILIKKLSRWLWN